MARAYTLERLVRWRNRRGGEDRLADDLGLPTGASAKRSITGMPGAIWCSTAFICPYGPHNPKSVNSTIMLSDVVIGATHMKCC
jgi:hypothetical protein